MHIVPDRIAMLTSTKVDESAVRERLASIALNPADRVFLEKIITNDLIYHLICDHLPTLENVSEGARRRQVVLGQVVPNHPSFEHTFLRLLPSLA